MDDDYTLSTTSDGKYPSFYIRDSEEVEAIRRFIKMGVKFVGPDGSPMSEEWALQKLSLQNPHMAFGVKKQAPDPRDKVLSFYVPPVPENITQSSLRPFESQVESQGTIGSCFAQTVVGALELSEVKAKRQFIDLSRMFNFYYTHKEENTIGRDEGATLRGTVKSLAKYGTCAESLWPYDISKMWTEPNPPARANALTRRISEYQTVPVDVMQVRGLLHMGFPIICGFDLFTEFMSVKVSLNGIVPDPLPKISKPAGGHAMLIVGFDDQKVSSSNEMGMFCLRNSWGRGWGDLGHAWVSYRYFVQNAFDPWVVLKDAA
jgi:C1A family cysteine protease